MKGQISIEFLIYFTLTLLILTFFLIKNETVNEELSNLKMDVEANDLIEKISFEIDSAVIAGDGYERKFFLDDSIGGFSTYSVEVMNYSVLLDWGDRSKSSTIITKSINGTINKKWNLIRNVDGVIYVN